MGEGEKRDQTSEAAAGGKKKKGSRRTRPLPKYPSRWPHRSPNAHTQKALLGGEEAASFAQSAALGPWGAFPAAEPGKAAPAVPPGAVPAGLCLIGNTLNSS